MSVWTDEIEGDLAEITHDDGVAFRLTPLGSSVATTVKGLWQGLSMEGGEQSGPYAWIADVDLPATFPQGSALQYPAVGGTTYAVAHKSMDGHGLTMLVLTDESTL